MNQNERKKPVAYYHLPGLFECYELYRVFLPLYRAHRLHLRCPGGLHLGRRKGWRWDA